MGRPSDSGMVNFPDIMVLLIETDFWNLGDVFHVKFILINYRLEPIRMERQAVLEIAASIDVESPFTVADGIYQVPYESDGKWKMLEVCSKVWENVVVEF